MEPWRLVDLAAACGGEPSPAGEAVALRRVVTDSRAVTPGDLFVALRGERFDAHDFLGEAVNRGAAAVLVDRLWSPPPGSVAAVIRVEDTRRALGRLAAAYRARFDLPVVAIAGSNGKTTTKDLLATTLATTLPTLASPASYNNDVGIPLTLLELEPRHRAAVIEAGTNHPGELAPLLRLVAPRYGLLTSLGPEHLEFFDDLEGVIAEEGGLAEALPANGRLFVNGDAPGVERVMARSRAPVSRVGFGEPNDWRATAVAIADHGTTFEVRAPQPEWSGEYHLKLLGRHQVTNALLVMAAAAELGLDRRAVELGLRGCPARRQRLQLSDLAGVQLLDDTYNANADSMQAALNVLAELPCRGRRVAVLGDMAELGRHTEAAHRDVGRSVPTAGVQRLFAVGRHAGLLARAAREAGLAGAGAYEDIETTVDALVEYLQPGDLILVKASRSSRLERIVEGLTRRLTHRRTGEPGPAPLCRDA